MNDFKKALYNQQVKAELDKDKKTLTNLEWPGWRSAVDKSHALATQRARQQSQGAILANPFGMRP